LKDFPVRPLKQRICRTLKKVAPNADARRKLWQAVLDQYDRESVANLTSGDISTTWRNLKMGESGKDVGHVEKKLSDGISKRKPHSQCIKTSVFSKQLATEVADKMDNDTSQPDVDLQQQNSIPGHSQQIFLPAGESDDESNLGFARSLNVFDNQPFLFLSPPHNGCGSKLLRGLDNLEDSLLTVSGDSSLPTITHSAVLPFHDTQRALPESFHFGLPTINDRTNDNYDIKFTLEHCNLQSLDSNGFDPSFCANNSLPILCPNYKPLKHPNLPQFQEEDLDLLLNSLTDQFSTENFVFGKVQDPKFSPSSSLVNYSLHTIIPSAESTVEKKGKKRKRKQSNLGNEGTARSDLAVEGVSAPVEKAKKSRKKREIAGIGLSGSTRRKPKRTVGACAPTEASNWVHELGAKKSTSPIATIQNIQDQPLRRSEPLWCPTHESQTAMFIYEKAPETSLSEQSDHKFTYDFCEEWEFDSSYIAKLAASPPFIHRRIPSNFNTNPYASEFSHSRRTSEGGKLPSFGSSYGSKDAHIHGPQLTPRGSLRFPQDIAGFLSLGVGNSRSRASSLNHVLINGASSISGTSTPIYMMASPRIEATSIGIFSPGAAMLRNGNRGNSPMTLKGSLYNQSYLQPQLLVSGKASISDSRDSEGQASSLSTKECAIDGMNPTCGSSSMVAMAAGTPGILWNSCPTSPTANTIPLSNVTAMYSISPSTLHPISQSEYFGPIRKAESCSNYSSSNYDSSSQFHDGARETFLFRQSCAKESKRTCVTVQNETFTNSIQDCHRLSSFKSSPSSDLRSQCIQSESFFGSNSKRNQIDCLTSGTSENAIHPIGCSDGSSSLFHAVPHLQSGDFGEFHLMDRFSEPGNLKYPPRLESLKNIPREDMRSGVSQTFNSYEEPLDLILEERVNFLHLHFCYIICVAPF
jgi:hypothetical protein